MINPTNKISNKALNAMDSNRELPFKAYISYGMLKSGSTFAFELTKQCFIQNGYPQPTLTNKSIMSGHKCNFLDHFTPERIHALHQETLSNNSIFVIKTHAKPTPTLVELISQGLIVGHAVYRDPRDMALSLIDAGRYARQNNLKAFKEIYTLFDAVKIIDQQILVFKEYITQANIIPVEYSDLTTGAEIYYNDLTAQTELSFQRTEAINHVNNVAFTQFNLGLKNRYRNQMDSNISKLFLEHYKKFYVDFFPQFL